MVKRYLLDKDVAYATGLFCADGHLSIDGRHLDFTSKDFQQVQNFKRVFNLTAPITKKAREKSGEKKYFCLKFSDVGLYRFFQELGVPQQKSLNIGKLRISTELFPDFLRGVFDGDGSIGMHNHPESEKKQIKIRIASGSVGFLNWINSMLKKGGLCSGQVSFGCRVFHLTFCKRDSLRLIPFIYYRDDLICLNRKRRIAVDAIKSGLDFVPDRWQNRYTKISRSGEIGKLASFRN